MKRKKGNYLKKSRLVISMVLLLALLLPNGIREVNASEKMIPMEKREGELETISGNLPSERVLFWDEEGLPVTYTGKARAAVDPYRVYTSKTRSNQDTSGNGSKENPYNRFEDAVENVKDGGTIYILASQGGFLNAQDEYGNVPFVINKSVTIEPEPGEGWANLSCRSAGIILGGNVTFKNIELNFANRYHDQIYANGYKLTLDNVSHSSSHRLVDLVAGSLYDKDSGQLMGGVPVGRNAEIVIKGDNNWFGNVYGGSLNGPFTGDVSITVESSRGMKIGEIYACGAAEPDFNRNDWFNFEEIAPPTADAVSFPVDGRVDILVKSSSVRNLDGAGVKNGTFVTYENEKGSSYVSFTNLSGLNVKRGKLELREFTAPTGVFPELAVPAGSILELQPSGVFQVANFSGGGKLILERTSTLAVEGKVTGNTIFETMGGYGGRSGRVELDHLYIDAGLGQTGTFSFTPSDSQPWIALEQTETGGWKTVNQSVLPPPPGLGEITFKDRVKTATWEEINLRKNKKPPVFLAELSGVPEDTIVYDYPFQFEVTHNGVTYQAETDWETYCEGYVKDLNMAISVEETEEGILTPVDGKLPIQMRAHVYLDTTNPDAEPLFVQPGSYDIKVFYPSDNGIIEDTVHLIVTEDWDSGDTQVPSQTELNIGTQSAVFGGKITAAATVSKMSGDLQPSELQNGSVQFYVNGKKTGEAVAYDSAKGAVKEIAVTAENGFRAGDNRVSAIFGGTTELIGSSKSVQLTVEKSQAKIVPGQSRTYVYDGTEHPADYSVTVSDKNIEVPTVVTYNDKNTVPVLPGAYQTKITAGETAVSKETTVNGPVINITKATPQIVLYTGRKDAEHMQAAVIVEGAKNGIEPKGTVTFYLDGKAVGTETLRFGQTVFELPKVEKAAELKAAYKDMGGCYTDKISEPVTIMPIDPSAKPVTDIMLDKRMLTLSVKDAAVALRAKITPSDATNQKVTYISDNPSVAKVDVAGKVTPVSTGTAWITVTSMDGGYQDMCRVVVTAAEPQPQPQSLEKAVVTLSIPAGGYVYNGMAKKPGVSVKLGNKTVEPGQYAVSYLHSNGENNNCIDAGKVRVKVTAVTNGSYTGTALSQPVFEIKKAPAAVGVTVTPSVQSAGNEVKVTVTAQNITDGQQDNRPQPGVSDIQLSIPLAQLQVKTDLHKVSEGTFEAVYTVKENAAAGTVTISAAMVSDSNYQAAEAQTDTLTIYAPKAFPFSDVKVQPGNWMYDSVEFVYSNNIMNGIAGTDRFEPYQPLTRAMFATVLYRMAGNPETAFETIFYDVEDNKYYSKAVTWAYNKEIVSGMNDGNYGINVNITREQIAKMLYQFALKQGYDVSGKAALEQFTDDETVSVWAKEYMQWAVNSGMISGKPNGDGSYRLDPRGQATRAECAKMLMMFMKKYL